ncbi:repressor of the inhibitor of the protein kinase [Amphibalanus amphitrite]|uniref:Repressor of the inhibitor of the protein kinase n=1 Tax=Amphibalanus amphitrite TaxID=1232801 RepID=A0A6A4X8K9_AMPAM|nr:repressor of the inhibitor of the protein kinase [Amphibalanus amphitrite]
MGKDGVYLKHEISRFHLRCKERATEFLIRTRNDGSSAAGDIRNLVHRGRRAEAEANRQALAPIIDAVLTCARQNIALRGHRDDGRLDEQEPPTNDGNFRSLLRLMMRHGNGVLRHHLKTSARNATYVSKTTQNMVLDSALAVIQNYIRAEVTDRFFSVLADETTDRAGREQLAIIFRYATQEEGRWCVREDPVRIVDLLREIKKGEEETEGEVRMMEKISVKQS